MTAPTTITIDGIKYMREDAVPQNIGTKRIIIADRGWVFIGDCEDRADGAVTIRNCKNIRKWGTDAGLGQLANGPRPNTVCDDYGVVVTMPIAQINVISGW